MERANYSSNIGSDLISSLPDPILHHILGLLETKEAVQTCMLSKRWEHLWTSLPSLRFNSVDFHRSVAPSTDINKSWDDCSLEDFHSLVDCSAEAACGRFYRFVNAFLLRRETLDLEVFKLSSPENPYDCTKHARDWIQYAMENNTRVLHLDIGIWDSLPCCTFTCTSLEELHLNHCRVDVSGIVNLSKLRKLSIYDEGHVKNILAGSPILEYLSVYYCHFDEWVIAHDHLKHLVIFDCFMSKAKLLVSAPSLLSFFYDGLLPLSSTLHMPSLSSACISGCKGSSIFGILKGIADFLHCFANVEFLELHVHINWQQELPVIWLSILPIFQKLQTLTVAFGTCSLFKMVTLILKSSPNLKKLTLLQQNTSMVKAELLQMV